MSISQVEREAGIAKGSICKWKSVSPSVGNVQSVAKVLGVTVNRLLRE
nr:MAG TPA: LAMBDA REPRESSOR (TRIPLE MUTANT)/DNA COMPLEX-DNA COMPLEX, DOUBLE HELIX, TRANSCRIPTION-DNA.1A [Caudoviricetes sp.]